MKYYFIIVLFCFCFFPMFALAEETYHTSSLEQLLTEAQIEHDLVPKQDNAVAIYLFYGKGCSYCKKLLQFLNQIQEEYGSYFEVIAYETWYNEDNNLLMHDIAQFLGTKADGVPFMIIGKKTFIGYNSSYDSKIKRAIEKEYKSKQRYDVLERKKDKKNNLLPRILIANGCLLLILLFLYSKKLFVRKKSNLG